MNPGPIHLDFSHRHRKDPTGQVHKVFEAWRRNSWVITEDALGDLT